MPVGLRPGNGYVSGMVEDAQSVGATIRVGPIALEGRALLAPMSGVTDVGMRRIACRFGASLVVSEMVASDDFVRGHEESRLRAEGAGVSPHVVQIAGCEPHWMGEAARLAEASGADAIDINMGCPAKRVTGGYAGSALMRTPDLALALIDATVAAVRIPVTLKMRLGWDDATHNAAAIARRAEDAGVRMLAIHGRTRMQFYKGRADWSAIRPVVEATRLPVIANGDCATAQQARDMLARSGAAGVMIGRAAVGRPWLVGEIARELEGRAAAPPSPGEKLTAALEHLETLLEAMGPRTGLRHARKHLSAYADEAGAALSPHGLALRLELVTTDEPARARALLTRLFMDQTGTQAA
ncbi:MAG: TIM-barrel, nifR3 family protein [Hyphomicrobiales bacterium]|nr:TIM-barrel, nifR3 family protein [Hyphomicrobiales bacterium]